MTTKNLDGTKLTTLLKEVAPTATFNEGTKTMRYGAWYIVSRYNTDTAKYIVLTAMVGTSGNLVGAVLTVEGADGKNSTVKPRTYKQVVAAFTK
jgi:hypothetical protein